MSSQQEQLEAISHVMGWCPATNHDACWYEMTLNEIKSKYEKPRLFEDEIDRELQVKQSEAITALIQEAVKGELEEVYSERQLVHDSVVTPMDWIIRPHKIKDRIRKLSGGSNNESNN